MRALCDAALERISLTSDDGSDDIIFHLVVYKRKARASTFIDRYETASLILLICLSFCYVRWTIIQLRQSLSHVLRSDDRDVEYERWLHGSSIVPDSLREYNALNLDNEVQLLEL